MGYGYMCGWYAFKASIFVVASFVFSLIFWSTKNWLEKKPVKKK
jgi:hypothetical protein